MFDNQTLTCIGLCYLCAGHHAVVGLLLKAGADPSATVDGQTPVDMAKTFDHADILSSLTAAKST